MVKLELYAGRRGEALRFAVDAKSPALARVHQTLDGLRNVRSFDSAGVPAAPRVRVHAAPAPWAVSVAGLSLASAFASRRR